LVYWRTRPENLADPFDPASAQDPKFKKPDVIEDYDNLTHDPTAINNVVSTINGASRLIRVWFPQGTAPTTIPPTGSLQEVLKNGFAILSPPQQLNLSTARPARDTTFGAQYYPWIHVYDPLTNDDRPVPAVGHVAGIYARTDIDTGVHKAPANAVVVGATDLD